MYTFIFLEHDEHEQRIFSTLQVNFFCFIYLFLNEILYHNGLIENSRINLINT